MNMDWDWFKIFYHVANERQISKAALKLNISQPAVSQSIKLLEEYIGFSLFIRKPKGVVLTNNGQEVFSYIKEAYIQFTSLQNKLIEINNSDYGDIRIGASDTLCSHYLLKYLKKYKEAHPKVKLHIFNMTTDEITYSLSAGKIDLGFINLPNEVEDKIQLTKIHTLQDCFICGENYRDIFSDPVSIKELLKYPILLLENGTNMRRFVDTFFKNNEVECTPELELGSIDLLTKFTKDNFGISFVTKNFIEDKINNGEVFLVNLIEVIPARAIGIIKMKDCILSKAKQDFYELFKY